MDGGAAILGHHAGVVSDAVTQALRAGVTAVGAHPLQAQVEQNLCATIAGPEAVRLVESGAAAIALAARAARSRTRRPRVVRCTDGDRHGLAQIFATANGGDIAALIVEATGLPTASGSPPAGGEFLGAVRAACQKHGALLIFDERRTAFRYALGGAQEHFGITADLTVLGPSLANGYPIGAVLGAASLLDAAVSEADGQDEPFRAPAIFALAAARATLQELRSKPVVGHLWEQGGRLRDGFNVLAAHYGLGQMARSHGLGPLSRIVFADSVHGDGRSMTTRFVAACRDRGLWLSDVQAVSFSHGQEDTDQIQRIYRTVLESIATGELP
jgi:glutamate-1-semialdehyde aminotransferase